MAGPKRSGQQIRKAYGKAPARGSDEWSRYGKTKQVRMTMAAREWSPEEDEYLLNNTSRDEYNAYKRKKEGVRKQHKDIGTDAVIHGLQKQAQQMRFQKKSGNALKQGVKTARGLSDVVEGADGARAWSENGKLRTSKPLMNMENNINAEVRNGRLWLSPPEDGSSGVTKMEDNRQRYLNRGRGFEQTRYEGDRKTKKQDTKEILRKSFNRYKK